MSDKDPHYSGHELFTLPLLFPLDAENRRTLLVRTFKRQGVDHLRTGWSNNILSCDIVS